MEAGGVFWRVLTESSEEHVRSGSDASMPLVVLHGLFGSGDNWRSHGRALSSSRTVLLPDLPGHGSSRSIDSFTYQMLSETMWNALEELGYGSEGAPVSLLGHSMGGKVAMAMALSRPAALSSLIVADISPKRYPPRHDTIFRAMERVAGAAPENRSAAERLMAEDIPEKAVRLFLLKSLVSGDSGYRWQLDLEGIRAGYPDITDWPYRDERYEGPVAVIAGGASTYVADDDRSLFSRHFPDVSYETIQEAGHWLHVEEKERFLQLVLGHLR